MDRLDGKVAIVTGAARGQGAATARLFVSEGAKVVLTDLLEQEGDTGSACLAALAEAQLPWPIRRQALRRIAGALASAAPPPYPPSVPCTVLWGAADEVSPPPGQPLSGLRIIENTGHLPHIEAVPTVMEAFRNLQDSAAGAS